MQFILHNYNISIMILVYYVVVSYHYQLNIYIINNMVYPALLASLCYYHNIIYNGRGEPFLSAQRDD